MQTAEHGQCLDPPLERRLPRDRLLLFKSLMRPGRVVEELAAESAGEAFGKRVHVWRPRCGSYHARARRLEHGCGARSIVAFRVCCAHQPSVGFNEKSLRRMSQFSMAFPEREIVATVSRELGWSHFIELIPLKEPLKRAFYAEMCRVERWSVLLTSPTGGPVPSRRASHSSQRSGKVHSLMVRSRENILLEAARAW